MARPAGDYRRTLVIDHTKVTGTQTDFPLMLRITGANAAALMGVSKARWDAKDCVLTTADGETVIPHIRHHAGKGIVTNGVWTWYTEPRAFHYAGHGASGVTYIGSVCANGDVEVHAYDHSTGASTYKKLSQTGIDDHTNATVHVTGTGRLLCALWTHTGSSFTHVRFASTTGDIESSQTLTNVSVAGTVTCGYPTYFSLSNGKSGPAERIFCIFYTSLTGTDTRRDLYYTYSDDDGATWSTPVQSAISSQTYAYWKSVSDKSTKIHFGYTSSAPNISATNTLHHFVLESDAGVIKWRKSDGSEITASLPWTVQTETTAIWDSTVNNLGYGTGCVQWISGIELDGTGKPGLCFGAYPGATAPINSAAWNDNRYCRAIWDGSAWTLSEIARGGDNLPYAPTVEYVYYAGVSLKEGDPNVALIATNYNTRTPSTNDGPHEIQLWTYAAGSWSKTTDITSGSGKGATNEFNYKHFRPVWVRNAHADCQVIWASGRYANYTTFDTVLNTYPNTIGTPIIYLTAKVPSVSGTVDTELYLYYGAATIAADSQAAVSSVLPATYKLFILGDNYATNSKYVAEIANQWYLAKSTTLISTPREIEFGGVYGAANSGSKFLRSQRFLGTANANNHASFAGAVSNSAKDFSILCWVKFATVTDSATYHRQTIFQNYLSSCGIMLRLRTFDGTSGTGAGTGHRFEGFTIDSGGSAVGGQFFIGQTNITADTWYFIALTFAASDNLLRFYLNGAAASETYSNPTWHATASVAGQWGSDGTNILAPGAEIERARFLSGSSAAALSAGMIATVYQNESAPEAFAVLGAEGPGQSVAGSFVALESGIRGLNRGIF